MNYTDHHQSRTFIRKIIAAAAAEGRLADLRYFIQMDIPSTHRRHGQRTQAANYPAGFIPTIPVNEDGAEDYAHLLLELFRSSNPGHIFRVALTDIHMLAKTQNKHYIWGEDPPHVDTICDTCGLVAPGRPGSRLGCSKGCLT